MFYYQSDETGTRFGVFPFRATYDGQTLYGNTRDELAQTVRELHGQTHPGDPFTTPEVVPVSLTAEQQARFDEITAVPDITLDDVAAYTLDGTPGVSPAWRFYKQQQTVAALEARLASMNTAIERGLTS